MTSMSTLEFLQTILPPDGPVYFLAAIHRANKYTKQTAAASIEELADMIDARKDDQAFDLYHACSSFQDDTSREQVNAAGVKSFWVDLDVDEEKAAKNKGYATQKDAIYAIIGFAAKIGWPRPMLVSSGYGVHAYWPLTKTAAPEAWTKMAYKLKAVLAHCGVWQDMSRTSDCASILRPLGTLNRKFDTTKPVRLIGECRGHNQVAPFCRGKLLADALTKYIDDHGVKLHQPPEKKVAALPSTNDALLDEMNADVAALAEHKNFPEVPSDANRVADKCAQIGGFRDHGWAGKGNYKVWFLSVGVIKHTTASVDLVHEWSAQDPEYKPVEAAKRWDTWGADGPSTCRAFEEENPGGCMGCPHRNTDKPDQSPLFLGRELAPPQEQVIEVLDDGEKVEVLVPELPTGYQWIDGYLVRQMYDTKSKANTFHPFSDTLLYGESRVLQESSKAAMGVVAIKSDKTVHRFLLGCGVIPSPSKLLEALGDEELFVTPHKDAAQHMSQYLKDQLAALKLRVKQLDTMKNFGWSEDEESFLLGERQFFSDGTEQQVMLGGSAQGKVKEVFPKRPTATLAGYADAINRLYNHTGAEHWQYALCAGWGSILSPFTPESLYRGLLLALQGGDTGRGKTSVCHAALYAFGNAPEMTIGTAKQGATGNAMWEMFGTYKNLPLLLDEMTALTPAEISDIAYGVSNGKVKERLKPNGSKNYVLVESLRWSLSPFLTGNCNFYGLLAQHQANSQAESARLIQLDVDRYLEVVLHPDPQQQTLLVQHAIDQLDLNQGAAGAAMAAYVVQNRALIEKEIADWVFDLSEHIVGPKFRFYRAHAACTLTMARITRDLGIHQFDLQALEIFTINMLRETVDMVKTTNAVTPEDAFHNMVTAMAGHILVTDSFADGRTANAANEHVYFRAVDSEVYGRWVVGAPGGKTKEAGRLYLVKKRVNDWCHKNRVTAKVVTDWLQSNGYMLPDVRTSLTRGTDHPLNGLATCMVIDVAKMDQAGTGLALVPKRPSANPANSLSPAVDSDAGVAVS